MKDGEDALEFCIPWIWGKEAEGDNEVPPWAPARHLAVAALAVALDPEGEPVREVPLGVLRVNLVPIGSPRGGNLDDPAAIRLGPAGPGSDVEVRRWELDLPTVVLGVGFAAKNLASIHIDGEE